MTMITQQNNTSLHSEPLFFNDLRIAVKEYFEQKRISKYGNWSLTAKAVLMVLVYFLPYILMLSGFVQSPWLVIMCWIIMGVGMAGVGMTFMHDANHGTITKHTQVNSWLSQSIFLLGGFPANWKFQHNILHHGYTNIDGHDDDIAPIGLLRFSPHKPLLKIHKWQHWYAWFFYGLLTLSWITIKDFAQFAKYKNQKGYLTKGSSLTRIITMLIFTKMTYFAIFLVLPLLYIQLPWYFIVLSFLLMHFVSGLILSTIFQTAHVVPNAEFPEGDVDGNVENHWAVHQLLNTTDFSPRSRIFSWLIGGLNYQVVHHLFPQISHVHYRHLSVIVKQTAQKHQLPYYVEDNFFNAFRSHVKMLKILGRLQPQKQAA